MLSTILPLSLASAFLMAFVTATPKDPGIGALCQEIVAIVSPTPGTLVATMEGAQGRWDGGDDSDSTYVPLDIYQMTILCTRLDAQDAAAGAR